MLKRKKGRERKKENIIEAPEVRRRTLSSALGVESPESGRVPWVWLESVIRCIAHTVCSFGENFINDEGTLPLGLELVLLLLGETQNEFANVISFGPYFSALIPSSLLLIECGTGFSDIMLLLQSI